MKVVVWPVPQSRRRVAYATEATARLPPPAIPRGLSPSPSRMLDLGGVVVLVLVGAVSDAHLELLAGGVGTEKPRG